MYTLLCRAPLRRDVAVEVPCCAAALAFAEFFYKFHSFTLECSAFLATWFVLSGLVAAATGGRRGRD